MADPLPLALQTTYRDLLDRRLRRRKPDVAGSILRISKDGHQYWVARHRIGDRVTEQRIGPDSPEVRIAVERLKAEAAEAVEADRQSGKLVASLRAARMPVPTAGTGKLINALARAGLFRSGAVLSGTHAFGLYALELGVNLDHVLAVTEDVDVALDRRVRIIADQAAHVSQSFAAIGLRPIAGPGDEHPVRWETADRVVLDLLTPLGRGRFPVLPHPGLGLWAQALPFLEFSLKGAIDAVVLYREGIPVRIPAPERYAVHKLIVASARTGTHRAKSDKDLQQASALIEVLAESRPYELGAALAEATGTGPKWRAAIEASLERSPEIRTRLADMT